MGAKDSNKLVSPSTEDAFGRPKSSKPRIFARIGKNMKKEKKENGMKQRKKKKFVDLL